MGGGMTAAEKKAMIEKMQNLMTEIVKLDKELSDNQTTNLKSPGLSDGVWGSNTEESYKSILAEHNKGKSAPKDMDEALKLLGQIRVSLVDAKNRDATQKKQESAKAPAATQTNPASAITDDQAKAAFRGLLESIQSGRIKLKAGGDNSVFKQRISRDWGAIIRAYKGPQGVVDAFYGKLALTEDEKTQLVEINKDGLDGTSTVVGKINQKFLEAINTYIKPFGRALRTERSMARVIKRRQERQERKQNRANAALKDLWILSKVAQRKEVARERLEKTAERNTSVSDINNLSLEFYSLARDLLTKRSLFSRSWSDQEKANFLNAKLQLLLGSNFDIKAKILACKSLMSGFLEKDMGYYLDQRNFDQDKNKFLFNLKDTLERNNININENEKFASSFNNLFSAVEKILNTKQEVSNTRQEKEDGSGNSEAPRETRRTPPTDLAELRQLLTKAGYAPGQGVGWASLDSAFRDAVEEFAKIGRKNLDDKWRWVDVAPTVFNTTPDISGAEKLVKALIGQQERIRSSNTETDAGSPATARAPTASTEGPVDKNDVVSGLESLFGQILSKEVKVDQEGADMRRDSKDFRGVIQGLGGARPAAVYCVEYCNFTPEENNQIIAYKDKTLEALAQKIDRSSVLFKIYRLFTDIRRQSRRLGRLGVTQRGLAANVRRWLQGQGQEKGAQASISKSIEIRKMAARKKLGLQS